MHAEAPPLDTPETRSACSKHVYYRAIHGRTPYKTTKHNTTISIRKTKHATTIIATTTTVDAAEEALLEKEDLELKQLELVLQILCGMLLIHPNQKFPLKIYCPRNMENIDLMKLIKIQ